MCSSDLKEEPASVTSGQVETVMEEAQETEDGNNGELILASPLKGRVIPLSEVPDETFASGVLGDGVGIQPAEGKVYAPFDCTVAAVFDTKHAIGLETSDGVELLIHIGMDTVKLNGEPFTVYVEAGETVKAGGLLVEFDMDKIKAAGLDTVTPVIVTNPGKYKSIKITGRQS